MKPTLFAVVSILFLALFTTPTRAADDAKPDAEGFIRNWLLLAPAPIPEGTGADEIDKKQIAEEASLKPKAGDKQNAATRRALTTCRDDGQNSNRTSSH